MSVVPAMSLLALLAAGPVTVPFLNSHRLIYVDLAVNGEANHLFLLDTGANKTAIDEALVRKLGLKTLGETTVEGTAGTMEVKRLRLDRLALAGREAKGLDVTVQSLAGFLAPEGRRVEGILGTDFLQRYSVGIDYERREITVGTPGLKSSIPFRMDNGIPCFRGRLDTVEAEFRLDTGASLFETPDVYVNIPTPLWETLGRRDARLKPEKFFSGSGVGGEVRLPVARVSSLMLGTREIARPWVIVQPRQGYFARTHAVGFFSNNLLEKWSPVVLDFPAGRLSCAVKEH